MCIGRWIVVLNKEVFVRAIRATTGTSWIVAESRKDRQLTAANILPSTIHFSPDIEYYCHLIRSRSALVLRGLSSRHCVEI